MIHDTPFSCGTQAGPLAAGTFQRYPELLHVANNKASLRASLEAFEQSKKETVLGATHVATISAKLTEMRCIKPYQVVTVRL